MDKIASTPSSLSSWQAHLRLDFTYAAQREKTLLSHNEHSGPLLVQKALYPEGNAICHAVVLHPPAGIAGGDHLGIELTIQDQAKVVITTPGATKWYKANQKESSQKIHIQIEPQSHLDFLPQENIYFDASNALNQIIISQQKSSSSIGWDISQLGRTAQGEHWTDASLKNFIEYYFDNELCWVESSHLDSQVELYKGPCGLGEFPVFGTMWLCSNRATEELVEEIAALLPWDTKTRLGVTRIALEEEYGLILIRGVSVEVEYLKNQFIEVWLLAREQIAGLVACPLRIWKT